MKPITIAIADSNILFREGVKRVFSPERDLLILGEAGTIAETRELVARLTPEVLILDLDIPDSGAVSVLAELKRSNVPTKVFVLTVSSEDSRILDAAKAGAHGYALKSIHPSALIQALKSIYQGEISVDRQLNCADAFVQFARQTQADHAGSRENQIVKLLSKRELEILALLANGLTNREISRKLFISVATVKIHLVHIYGKLNVKNRIQAALTMLKYCSEIVKEVGARSLASVEMSQSAKSMCSEAELSDFAQRCSR